MKHLVTIKRVEQYSYTVVVEAENEEDAVNKVQASIDRSDTLLDEMRDCGPDDTKTDYEAFVPDNPVAFYNYPDLARF